VKALVDAFNKKIVNFLRNFVDSSTFEASPVIVLSSNASLLHKIQHKIFTIPLLGDLGQVVQDVVDDPDHEVQLGKREHVQDELISQFMTLSYCIVSCFLLPLATYSLFSFLNIPSV